MKQTNGKQQTQNNQTNETKMRASVLSKIRTQLGLLLFILSKRWKHNLGLFCSSSVKDQTQLGLGLFILSKRSKTQLGLLLFILSTTTLASIINCHNLNHHFCADDTQNYLPNNALPENIHVFFWKRHLTVFRSSKTGCRKTNFD